jgi:hypothetical protein
MVVMMMYNTHNYWRSRLRSLSRILSSGNSSGSGSGSGRSRSRSRSSNKLFLYLTNLALHHEDLWGVDV